MYLEASGILKVNYPKLNMGIHEPHTILIGTFLGFFLKELYNSRIHKDDMTHMLFCLQLPAFINYSGGDMFILMLSVCE